MLSDSAIKKLKAQDKPYKVTDRDGMYVYVSTTGVKSFRFDYTFNKRRETLTLGRYGIVTLSQARDALLEAKKQLNAGISPSQAKKAQQRQSEDTIAKWWQKYLDATPLAAGTHKIKTATYTKEIEPFFANTDLSAIKPHHIREHCEAIVERGAPTTSARVRDIFNGIYNHAILKGLDLANPAAAIHRKSLHTKQVRSRALKPKDIALFLNELAQSDAYPSVKNAIKLLLLTMSRKSEVVNGTWEEVDFEHQVWTIPAARMKSRKEHNIYLSEQALALLQEQKILSYGSDYIFPARGNKHIPMAVSSVNRVANRCIKNIQLHTAFEPFVIHDFRRTASTLLHEQGYHTDHIEKCLAHQDLSIRGVYNKAEYEAERRKLLQDWANDLTRLELQTS